MAERRHTRVRPHVPASTYRLQLTPRFGFAKATLLLDYLVDLGITHLYLSPILEARTGSDHGYDVTDPTRIRDALGGEEGFETLCAEARERGLGIVLDIVPNHMAASPENRRWMDVLENGAASPWAHWFDIGWRARGRPGALETHLLLPILGHPYGAVLEDNALRVGYEAGAFFVSYHDWTLPLSPRSWPRILEPGLGVLAARLDPEHPAVTGLTDLIAQLSALPPWTATDPDEVAARARGEADAKGRLATLHDQEPHVAEHVEENLKALTGTPGKPETFDRLDALLSAQPYRLCFWKLSTERVSYRRFFDIGHLVGIRVEDRRVFRETHDRILALIQEGRIQGLRIDHIDGLLDPESYLRKLRRAAGKRAYLVVEKILEGNERLPESWPVQGTTGYEALHLISGPFVDRRGLERLSQAWSALPGTVASFDELVYRCKRMVLESLFGGELQALTSDLHLAAERDRHGRDLSPRQIGDALLEVSASLPAYRTYLRGETLDDDDRRRVETAIAAARRRNPGVDRHAYDLLGRLLTLTYPHALPPSGRRAWRRVVQRWQQLTGPAMAKGLEDTALYRDARLVALNEVGADAHTLEDPAGPERFHAAMAERQARWPGALTTTSTHDSKRSEDVRARLLVLSELAAEWEAAVARWSRWHRRLRKERVTGGGGGATVPDPATERFVYQTLVGVWPLDPGELPSVTERVQTYLRKAAREAKMHTSWIDPDEAYEAALLGFAADLCDPDRAPRFHAQLGDLAPRIAFLGAMGSLAMTQLKLTVPGAPDIYQGTELWRHDLADPDNRRPVDFQKRRAFLQALDSGADTDPAALLDDLLTHWRDGRAKLWLTSRLLRHRRDHPRLYHQGAYLPLEAAGRRRHHLLAFARQAEGQWAVSVAPRLMAKLVDAPNPPIGAVWRRTVLRLPAKAPDRFHDVVSGRTVEGRRRRHHVDLDVADLLAAFPTALLES